MTPQQYERLTELFHAALEIAPDERAAFLAQVSDRDVDVRRELESLLASQEQGTFAETPPDDMAAGYLAQQGDGTVSLHSLAPNTRLDHFEIRSLLGRGGMGEVYLAEDTRLHRKVALKILPAAVATDQDRMRRFEQEAAAAAALNHPHIAHIYEIGESAGTHFIAIEHIDGDTLRDKIHRDNAPLEKLLKYLTQVAEGLTKAHSAGIVHRDLKPDNIMITRDDYAKILDFGLAKLVENEGALGLGSQTSEVVTRIMAQQSLTGMVMGTAGYMSPEQAQGRVKEIDQRSDIFSFGCVLFEAATGHKPFEGEDILDSLHNIVHAPTPQIKERNPNAPHELQRILRRCLAKDPEERYQTIKDVALELKEVRQGMAGAAEVDTSVPPSGSTGTLGHQTTDRSAIATSSAEYLVNQIKSHKRGVAIALAVVVVVAASLAYFFYFRHKRAPVLSEQDTILIADFDNKTGEEIFDDTLKQGLAVQLEQSPFLNLFADTRVRETLKLMNRSPDARVTTEIGREICQRHGLKALIAGSIAPLGGLYVLTLTAINSTSGEVIAREQMPAEGREQVLKALSQAAIRLREKLGESLNSIQRFAAPKEATTSSLEALKAYSQALLLHNSGKWSAAIRYFKRAVEIDPNFVTAYSAMAFSYANTSQTDLAAQSAEKAYALRDRVSEVEQLAILDSYFGFVTGEIEKRIENAELRKTLYPRKAGPYMHLSISYLQIGQFEKVIPEASETLRLVPKSIIAYGQLGIAFTGLNRFAEAREIFERGLKQSPDHTPFHGRLYLLSFVAGDTAAMQQQLDWAKGKPDELVTLDWQTGPLFFAGQWRRAQDLSRRSIDDALRSDAKQGAAEYLAEAALRGAAFHQCTQSKTAAMQALALDHNPSPTTRVVLAMALCGEASQATRLIDELVRRHPQDTRINGIWAPTIRAAIELQGGQAQAAVDLLEGAKRYEAAAEFWPQYLRGQAYFKLGRGAEAAVEFQKILDHRGQSPLSVLYPLAHLGLARAAARSGDTSKARQAYQDFFALWKDADADLPVLIEAKKEYEKLK